MQQFVRFLVSGGIAAALNWGSRFLFSLWMPYSWAIAAAFLVGLGSGFVLMRFFVFEGRSKPVVPQATKFVLVNLAGLAQTLVISLVAARWLLPAIGITESAEAIGHLAGVLVPVVTSYIGHKALTFR